MIGRAFGFLADHATWFLLGGVFSGFVLPSLADLLRPLLAPAVWILLFLAALRLDGRITLGYLRRPAVPAGAVIWMLVVAPVAAWIAGRALGLTPGLITALVLMAGSAPIISAPALAGLIGLDAALTMVAMVAATLAVPLTLPLLSVHVLGLELATSAADLSLRLAGFVASALIAAWVIRRAVGMDRLAARAREMDAWSVILLLVFAVAIMEGVTARAFAEPRFVTLVVVLAFTAYGALFLAGRWLFAFCPRRSALTIGFTGANRNMALLLAILPAGADPDIALYFALGQLPMYTLPALLRPFFRHMVRDP